MQCARCEYDNPAGHKFCGQCGASLPAPCPSCGARAVAGEKFCGQCGGALAAASPEHKFASPKSYTPGHLARRILESRSEVEGERKQVTVLFADLKGSMELLADRDPEDSRALPAYSSNS
ncbi:MAG: hypothetical protein EXR36_10965 [Betaproteobacteria bacterium]|nr:hypothetical protein [Betaproteobacteria bacterium]